MYPFTTLRSHHQICHYPLAALGTWINFTLEYLTFGTTHHCFTALVFLRFTFNQLFETPLLVLKASLSNSLYFQSLKPSHPLTKFYLSILLLYFPRLHSLQLLKAMATTQVFGAHRPLPYCLQLFIKQLFSMFLQL